jgi:hypothetical protein
MILITHENFLETPKGALIKYKTLNNEIKTAGFLIKIVDNKDITLRYLIIKSNKIFKLYLINFWIYYIKKKSKREIFINLLHSLKEKN